MKKIMIFTPAIAASNIGDEIIYEACDKVIKSLYPDGFYVNVSTHLPLDSWLEQFQDADLKFVAGSNLLGRQRWRKRSQWNLHLSALPWAAPSILMGVGWHRYQRKSTALVSKYVYRQVLSRDYIHSVRDNYTLEKLKEIGFDNALNTGCPTMWSLTPEHCQTIPLKKSEKVLTTVTDYHQDPQKDADMLDVLTRNYREVYVWLQGYHDYDYLQALHVLDKVKIVPPNLAAYQSFLNNEQVDYVGTRLHSGIKALQCGKRTVIIGIDNRANEKQKDFNLPVLRRENITELEALINTSFITQIHLPSEHIQQWKNQFAQGQG